MRYSKAVKEKIKFLKEYDEDRRLEEFDIFHLYPKGLAYPNGYYDSRNFILIGFNSKIMRKRNLGIHDGLDFWEECPKIQMARVFCDGAFLIRMECLVRVVGNTQAVSLTGIEKEEKNPKKKGGKRK